MPTTEGRGSGRAGSRPRCAWRINAGRRDALPLFTRQPCSFQQQVLSLQSLRLSRQQSARRWPRPPFCLVLAATNTHRKDALHKLSASPLTALSRQVRVGGVRAGGVLGGGGQTLHLLLQLAGWLKGLRHARTLSAFSSWLAWHVLA